MHERTHTQTFAFADTHIHTQVGALCAAVLGWPEQQRRLCDWLLEVARSLLDPTPPARKDVQKSDWMRQKVVADVELRRSMSLDAEDDVWRRSCANILYM